MTFNGKTTYEPRLWAHRRQSEEQSRSKDQGEFGVSGLIGAPIKWFSCCDP